MRKIDPKQLDKNVFSLIGDQWMLITAGTVERCNTMTASWGGLGVIWGHLRPPATSAPSGTPRSLWMGTSISPCLSSRNNTVPS